MPESATATAHVPKDAPAPSRPEPAPEAVAPEVEVDADLGRLVGSLHQAGSGAGAGAPPPPRPPTWTARTSRTPHDLAALQRLAGNRAVAGLVSRRAGPVPTKPGASPTLQRQPKPETPSNPKTTGEGSQPEAPTLDEMAPAIVVRSNDINRAAKHLSEITKALKGPDGKELDAVIYGLESTFVVLYDRSGQPLADGRRFALELPKGTAFDPGVYVTPPGGGPSKRLRFEMATSRVKVFETAGVLAEVTGKNGKNGKGAAGVGPNAPAAGGKAGSSAAGGKAGQIEGAEPGAAPGAAGGDAAGGGSLTLDLRKAVKDLPALESALSGHQNAAQFFLVRTPLDGGGSSTGKPGGARTTGFAGEIEGKGPPPNAPPWPVSIEGPRMLNIGGVAPFAAKINWASNDSSLIGMVTSQMGIPINYRWEVFNVTAYADKQLAKSLAQAKETEAVAKAVQEQGLVAESDPKARAAASKAGPAPGATGEAGGGAQSGSAAEGGNAAGGGPGAGGAEPTFDDQMAAKAREKVGSGDEVDPMAGADLEFNRKFTHLWEDTKRAKKDLGSKRSSSYLERHSENMANLAALELLPVSVLVTSVGASLTWLAELVGSEGDQREIPIKEKGHYLVRVIATPRVQTDQDGNPIIRPSTVASQVIEVVEFQTMVREGLDEPGERVDKARLAVINAGEKFGEDSEERKELQAKLEMTELETGGDPKVLLERKIKLKDDELTAVKAKYGGMIRGPIIEVENQLTTLRRQLEIFELQKHGQAFFGEPVTATPMRLNAMLASEVTGQPYPLILSAAPIAMDGKEFGWKILDVTSKKGEGIVGRGSSSSAALYRALENFGRKATYGRGTIGIRLPPAVMTYVELGAPTELQVESAPAGWAIAKARIDDLVMVLVALGLLVSSAGTAAALIGAAVAAARLMDRLYNGTLELDEEAISDGLAVLGGIGIGAQKAAGMGIKHFGSKFALVPEGAASEAKIVEATRAFHALTNVAKGVEAANEAMNYAGVLWGNITFAGQLATISREELEGKVTHAEARRQRAAALGGAIQNNGLFLAGNYMKAREAAKAGKTGAKSESKAPTSDAEPTPTGKAEPTPRDTVVPTEPGAPKERAGAREQAGVREPAAPTEPGPPKETGSPDGSRAVDGEPGAKASPKAGETGRAKAPVATDGPAPRAEPAAGGKPAVAPDAPKPGSAQERTAAHKNLIEAARGKGDLRAAAEDAIGKGGSWKEDLKGALKGLEGAERLAAETALVEARDGMVKQEWEKVQASDERFAALTLENTGTSSFTSDIDATVRPSTEARVAGAEMGNQIKLAAEAAQKLSDALRDRVRGETDTNIDTNIYSFIGEGRLKPVDPRSRAAQQHVDVIVGLAEQLRSQDGSRFDAFEQRLLKKARDPRVRDEIKRVVGDAREFQRVREAEWQKALREAGVPPKGKPTPKQERIAREAILGVKKGELGGLMAGEPPNFGEIARKQSEINWFAPDAYATPSAFHQAVAHGQRLKGTGRKAAGMKAEDVAKTLREQAAKLPKQDPRARRLESEAKLVESQQRLLEMTLAELKTAREQMLAEQEHGPAPSSERVQELERRAAGLREAITRSAERLLIAELLDITAPADQPGPERLSQSAAAAGANLGMLEAHVSAAKDLDGQVKASAKYAGRIAMAEMLAGLKTSTDQMAQLIGEFVKSRWSVFEAESPQIMRDMFLRYAELKGRHQDIVRNAAGEPVGVKDRLKMDFVEDAGRWARDANDALQLASIGSKAFSEPAMAGAAVDGSAGSGGGPGGAPGPDGPGSDGAGGGSPGGPGPDGPRPGATGAGLGGGGGAGGPGGGPGGGPARGPLPAALQQRIAELRRRIGDRRAQAYPDADQLEGALDQMLARTDLLVRDVEVVVESMTEGLEPAAPIRDTELVRVDPREPAVRASLETALRKLYTSGDPLAGQYVDIILEAYGRLTQIDLGYSPRRTDAERIRNTDRMRATFVAALDSGALDPRAADIFLEHLSQSRRGTGGEAASFARGDLIWIDRASGARADGPGQGAVPWPATNGNAWWVDHIVELQHGGADAPSNYLPLPDRLNFLKSGAMTKFTNGFRETQRAARAAGEDVSTSAPDPTSDERRRRAITPGRR